MSSHPGQTPELPQRNEEPDMNFTRTHGVIAAEILAGMGLLEEAALAEAEVVALDVLNRASAPQGPPRAAEGPKSRPMSFRGAARLLREALGQDPAFRLTEGAPALEGRYLREG